MFFRGFSGVFVQLWRSRSDFLPLMKVSLTKRKPDTLGNRGEDAAARFLIGLGYKIIDHQSRGRFGEIDLIANDGDVIVFVEVKTRSSIAAGDPTEAVTVAKQRKITQSALAYLRRRGWLNRRTRFDVVAVLWANSNEAPTVRHYKHAFEATGFGQLYS
jgi:putative endonuclease